MRRDAHHNPIALYIALSVTWSYPIALSIALSVTCSMRARWDPPRWGFKYNVHLPQKNLSQSPFTSTSWTCKSAQQSSYHSLISYLSVRFPFLTGTDATSDA